MKNPLGSGRRAWQYLRAHTGEQAGQGGEMNRIDDIREARHAP